ncbi:MAG: VWA domain-containing protein, partial [Deltaproteobacteria bacterium]|nr:VWA domain-containing protein [Deltaproteobacteria bacterium]
MRDEPSLTDLKKCANNVTLSERITLFSHFLKQHGFKVFSSSVMDSLQGLEEIDISKKDDFFAILRTNLVTSDLEWRIFEDLFEEFWQGFENDEEEQHDEESMEQSGDEGESGTEMFAEPLSDKDSLDNDACENVKEFLESATYSPVSIIEKKDLGQFDTGDIQVAQLILKNLMASFKTRFTRRYRRSRKASDIDFRRIIRKSVKAGGIPLDLCYRRRKKRLKRLVVLADVSGSMDRYARFVMPFILGLRGIGPKAEIFVFSTSLTPITHTLRRFSFEHALDIISNAFPEWSGGTRIGFSLHQFNVQYGDRLLTKKTVVVILSDGWDLGGKEL